MPRQTVRMFLDALASRVLPSAAPTAVAPHPAAEHTAPPRPVGDPATTRQVVHLGGAGGGYAVEGPKVADGLQEYRVHGTADLAGPGKVSVHGTVWGADGKAPAAGVLTFRDGKGSITIEFDRRGGSGEAHYHVVDGSGTYRHAHGEGELRLTLDPAAVHLHNGATGAFELTVGHAAAGTMQAGAHPAAPGPAARAA